MASKRCFICGAKEDLKGNCSNSKCPRYGGGTTENANNGTSGA
ncbi:hypothetical protein [Sporomusa acidovorans]|uniref:Rubredoxin n=1 Tax=Sporomusa acidovorans (strain ATCC 49682 / DSM 3132 / Mol) TaxID=1123286 RepID=A0ABZ3J9B6_SPOA4|nr:hypothetical protein [Sporomusa acidovorans]OZC15999.1 hypothetical protein SPACI_43650 [Sporomusa acidovorans DSM 3132]SDD90180.1 hypothetical protein SAMN04488499_1005132 [Sporomusa acidovorans]